MAVQNGEPSTARSCRSRTRSRARSTRRSTRSPSRRPTCGSSRRSTTRSTRRCIAAARGRDRRRARACCRTRRRPRSARASSAERLPGAEIVSTHVDRRGRAHRGRAPSEPWAAIGPRLSADLYGAQVLAERIEDYPDNLTRFVWLAPAGTRAAPRRATKTSVVFWGFDDRSPGALMRVLGEFADREINLTQDRVAAAARGDRPLHVLRRPRRAPTTTIRCRMRSTRCGRRVEVLRVLGSYPAAVTRS